MTRRRGVRHAFLGVVLAAGCALLAGCGESSSATAEGDGVTGRVTVLAAASLTDAFTELAERFEAEHDGVHVVLSFGGSSGLAQQVVTGVPADVFAAASPETMATVVDAGGAASEPEVFARNRMQVVVPAGNPASVRGLRDLADPERTVALCAGQVPCGAAAEQVFAVAGLRPAPDTLEQDVKAVLTKVQLGEVDAGLVYRTDVIAAGDSVLGLPTPQADRVSTDYLVAVLSEAPNSVAAQAFVAFVRSAEGRRVLSAAGFETP